MLCLLGPPALRGVTAAYPAPPACVSAPLRLTDPTFFRSVQLRDGLRAEHGASLTLGVHRHAVGHHELNKVIVSNSRRAGSSRRALTMLKGSTFWTPSFLRPTNSFWFVDCPLNGRGTDGFSVPLTCCFWYALTRSFSNFAVSRYFSSVEPAN